MSQISTMREEQELRNLRYALSEWKRSKRANEVKIQDHVAAARRLRAKRPEIDATIAHIRQRIKEAERGR